MHLAASHAFEQRECAVHGGGDQGDHAPVRATHGCEHAFLRGGECEVAHHRAGAEEVRQGPFIRESKRDAPQPRGFCVAVRARRARVGQDRGRILLVAQGFEEPDAAGVVARAVAERRVHLL